MCICCAGGHYPLRSLLAMPPLLKLHVWKLTGLLLAANFGLLAYLGAGTLKALGEWNWTDIGGEGGSALLVLVWIGLVVERWPGGPPPCCSTAWHACSSRCGWIPLTNSCNCRKASPGTSGWSRDRCPWGL